MPMKIEIQYHISTIFYHSAAVSGLRTFRYRFRGKNIIRAVALLNRKEAIRKLTDARYSFHVLLHFQEPIIAVLISAG